jgi:molybdopterin-guanine dinucleotide biosynthesis protein A/enamine deaminase RidA (YjgF/YER057c/UK114 family)
MTRQLISSGAKWEPEVGYSRAVRTGNRIFVSGTTSADSRGRIVDVSDVAAETRRIFEIIEAALAEAGASLEDVVRTRMFVTDIASDSEVIGKIHGEKFGKIRPAATMVEVARLIDPRLRVEIEVDAVAGSGGCDAVILAGGKSRRMGRDKRTLRVGNRTLLSHTKAALSEAGWKARVVSDDLKPGLGPLGGIATALRKTNHSRVLFVGCDMPFLSGELLRQFFDEAVFCAGSIFTRHAKGMGFPFLLRRDDLKIVEQQIAKGALSLQRLAKRLAARAWEPSARFERQLFNINTPDDLAEAKRRWKESAR